MVADPELAAVIAAVPEWRTHEPTVTPIEAGRTNRNFRVEVGDAAFFLRLSDEDTALLGIDRTAEYEAAIDAAAAGVGPEVVAHLPEHRCLITGLVPGEPLAEGDMEKEGVANLKIRDRIKAAVRIRLERHAGDREAARRALALLSLPFNAPLAMRLLYRTVDAMWYAAGDTSTDFNFYTKRATLAGVYSSTLLYWLNDRSPGCEATWAFLDRRIDDVMKIEKLKSQVKSWTGSSVRTASRR